MSLVRVPIHQTRNLAIEIDPGARTITAGNGIAVVTNGDDSVTISVNGAPVTVTGSRASGAALVSLLTALASLGLIIDNTTA